DLSRYREMVEDINALSESLVNEKDSDLLAKTEKFQHHINTKLAGFEDSEDWEAIEDAALSEILPEAFAVLREVAHRKVGLRHYDVQLIGGIVLHEGKIAELRTGEGKTLAATLAAYLHSL